jgi:eukaryotic-like serine/threonine-protein kinase
MAERQFAHYVVLEQAGAGAMGVVFRARDERLQRQVAIKIPAPSAVVTEELRGRWLEEARATCALNHPNICTIYEVGEFEGQPYIAMEYLAGAPLNECIPDDGLPTETVLEYGAQIASALDHAHSQGILHRDLKSANVRKSGSGQVKVLDFGLAATFKPMETATQTSPAESAGAPGTLAYMAPEVLGGTRADVRSDIWSLGVLLYEMASRAQPFPGRTTYQLCGAILKEAPRPLPMHVPPGLRAIILRCLAKQPEHRYQRASEVKAALEALHSNGGEIAAAAAGVFAEAERPTGRTRKFWWLAAGVALVAVAVLLVGTISRLRVAGPVPTGRLRQLLAAQRHIEGPGLSPDGKMLTYVEDEENTDDLYVTRVAGGERMKLTNDVSRKDWPAFSPDGEKIVFARKLTGEPEEEICTIPTLGGQIVSVTRGGSMPAWSPDGTRIAFVKQNAGEAETVAIVSLDGNDLRTILAGDAIYPFLGRPAWSPDGQSIAVARSRGGDSREIWLVPVNGGAASQLTHGTGGVSSDQAVFSADGRGIVYRSNRGGAQNIWYQDLSGNVLTQLTTGAGPDAMPSVARDGTLAFLNFRARTILELYELATGESKMLVSESGVLWGPAFSPDGKEVAYSRSEPAGAWHLWAISTAGGAPHQLTSGKLLEIYPRYTPDGQQIIYSTWGPEPLSIGVVARNGGATRVLKQKNTTSDSYPDISPDGKWIVFVRTENKLSHMYLQAANGSGEAREIGTLQGTVPRWSPDGKWIAFSPNRGFGGGAYIVHPDGSGLKRVAQLGGWPVWWPGGGKLGLQTIGPDGNTELSVVTLATGETRVLPGLRFNGTNYPFDVSRDGKWLVTTNTQDEMDEIWLLEPRGK